MIKTWFPAIEITYGRMFQAGIADDGTCKYKLFGDGFESALETIVSYNVKDLMYACDEDRTIYLAWLAGEKQELAFARMGHLNRNLKTVEWGPVILPQITCGSNCN